MPAPHEQLFEKLLERRGTVALLGGIDTGKTSFGIGLAHAAVSNGIPTAYVDADVGHSTVGPPACVGLKFVTGLPTVDETTLAIADELAFVGSIAPDDHEHLVPLISGTGRLVAHAREAGAELVIVDTTGLISGVFAEILKYHKMLLIQPDAVVGFQRGAELDPLLGVVQRFLPSQMIPLKVHDQVVVRSAVDRVSHREEKFRAYFSGPLQRWKVKPTVFMPPLPEGVDTDKLDGLLVGLHDGKGKCLGVGRLEYDGEEQVLRMLSPVTEGATGLLLGSVRIAEDGRTLGSVGFGELLGSE